jgi:hypothetical protein
LLVRSITAMQPCGCCDAEWLDDFGHRANINWHP